MPQPAEKRLVTEAALLLALANITISDATTTTAGKQRRATDAEVAAGTSTVGTVNPAQVKARLDALVATITAALGGKQPADADLTAIAALTSAANKLLYATGAGAWALADLTAFARTLLAAATAADARAALGIEPTPVRFSAATAVVAVTGSDRAGSARTITSARMRCATAPVGSALIVQVQHSADGSSWTTVTTLSIAAGSTAEASATGLTQAQSAGHLVRLNVTSVGSGTAATGVVVDVYAS